MSAIPFYNLPQPNEYKIKWSSEAIQTYARIDGFISGVNHLNKDRASLLTMNFKDKLDQIEKMFWADCDVELNWGGNLNFSIFWTDKETKKFFMSGGLIFHSHTNTWAIHS